MHSRLCEQTHKAMKMDYQRTLKRPDSVLTEMIGQKEEREFFEKIYSKQIHTYKTNVNRLSAIQKDFVY